MQSQFNELGIPFTRVPAVDGKLLSDAEFEKFYQGLGLSKVEVACFLSHRNCWELIVNSSEDYGVIFEDDVHMSENMRCLMSLEFFFPKDLEILKLETFRNPILQVSTSKINIFNNIEIRKLFSEHLGGGAYVISKKCANKLLGLSKNFSVSVDHFLFDPKANVFRDLNVYQIFPGLCIQDMFLLESVGIVSTIDDDRLKSRNQIQKNIFSSIRKELLKPFKKIISFLHFAFYFALLQRTKKKITYLDNAG